MSKNSCRVSDRAASYAVLTTGCWRICCVRFSLRLLLLLLAAGYCSAAIDSHNVARSCAHKNRMNSTQQPSVCGQL